MNGRYLVALVSLVGALLLAGGCSTVPAAAPAPTARPAAAPAASSPAPLASTAASPTPSPTATATRTATPPAATATATAPAATPTTVPAAAPTATAAAPQSAPAVTPTAPAQKAATSPTPAQPTARITTSDGRVVTVNLEMADTPQSRAIGLSRRQSLPENAGMLFVFPSDQQAAFWMKDTWIPLSIAFISSDGKILEIQDMQANTEDLHQPASQYRYSLEVNQGFFKKNGVTAGDRVEFRLGGNG